MTALPRIVDLTIDLPGTFAAYRKAETALHGCGFSVGRMEAHSPTGILFGDFDIQKWRNLNDAHRAALHGTLTGSFRNGPVRLFLLAPNEDVAARLRSALAGHPQP